jgi:hypothetical protein
LKRQNRNSEFIQTLIVVFFDDAELAFAMLFRGTQRAEGEQREAMGATSAIDGKFHVAGAFWNSLKL